MGVLTAVAPRRFSAALNQAPMPYTFARFGLTLPVDWIVNRWRVRKRTAMSPAHLLRRAFEACASYGEAKHALAATPICIPALFTLAGAVANHWINPHFKGRARPILSRSRRAKLSALLASLEGDLDWLVPPVLNAHTRLAVEMNAGLKTLLVQGWHGREPRT
jgi:hypothetical protein